MSKRLFYLCLVAFFQPLLSQSQSISIDNVRFKNGNHGNIALYFDHMVDTIFFTISNPTASNIDIQQIQLNVFGCLKTVFANSALTGNFINKDVPAEVKTVLAGSSLPLMYVFADDILQQLCNTQNCYPQKPSISDIEHYNDGTARTGEMFIAADYIKNSQPLYIQSKTIKIASAPKFN